MRNKRTIWLLLTFFLVSLLAAMGWITHELLAVEQEEQEGHRRAALEQNVRLALWRMESLAQSMASNIAQPPSWAIQPDRPVITSGFYLDQEQTTVVAHPKGSFAPPAAAVQAVLAQAHSGPLPAGNAEEQVERHRLEYVARRRFQQRAGAPQFGWVNGKLLLVGRTSKSRIIGWVCDWQILRPILLRECADLLSQGDLQPLSPADSSNPMRDLITLPVRLSPGTEPAFFYQRPTSPARLMLLVAWSCMFLPAAGLGVLLFASYSLNERRDAFVSAVTHELRTPLTTFSMYTEMLEGGMVKEEKYPTYFSTLRREALRLSHLVENVLLYARIERGKTKEKLEKVTVAELLERNQSQLQERVNRANASIEFNCKTADIRVRVDAGAIERVLTNLVDNACKYGCNGDEKRIILSALATDGKVRISVRDFGPGISAGCAKRLFRPFSKSDREAAVTAPGVGLGLALSRRLMRRMDGDLYLDGTITPGACFVFELPVVA